MTFVLNYSPVKSELISESLDIGKDLEKDTSLPCSSYNSKIISCLTIKQTFKDHVI